jgi:hypothetical protein
MNERAFIDREEGALRRAIMNIDEEQMDRPRRPPVDIDALQTQSSLGDSWMDDDEEAEADDAFVPGASGDSSSELDES